MNWAPVILTLPYFFIILLIYRRLLLVKTFIPQQTPTTFVSVIVACRNEEKNLPGLLEYLSLQNYPSGLFEVIIIDDNSSDETFKTASAFTGDMTIRVLRNSGSGKKKAIRTGVNVSKGDLILTTDADCQMGRNWIRTITAFYEENNSDVVICPVKIKTGNSFFEKFQEIEFLSLQGITCGTALSGNSTMCNGANLAFKKSVYLHNADNLHDEIGSGDDIFLLHSVKKNKGKISWLESMEALVKTKASSGADAFLSQRRRWVSKSINYTDTYTIVLAIVTFVTILIQLFLLTASLFNVSFLLVFISVYLVKSIPDYLIIRYTASRYGSISLMNWFVPAQIIYPFYLVVVVCSAPFRWRKKNG